jgi:hypothetical protein
MGLSLEIRYKTAAIKRAKPVGIKVFKEPLGSLFGHTTRDFL